MAISTEDQTQVFLIRHGIAAERGTYADDNQRPLVSKGTAKTRQIAQRLASLALQFDTLLSSPLVRAVQTAELLCQAELAENYQVFDPLAPDGHLEDWLSWLTTWQMTEHRTLAMVGHEPDLSRWAQTLVHGSGQAQWILKKAGIIGLIVPKTQPAIGHSQLFWLAPPRLLV